jgi:hypothetical protein
MNFSVAAIAGIAATLGMSAFTAVGFYLVRAPYHVIRILGNMMRFKKVTPLMDIPPMSVYILTIIVHYTIGILFAISFALILRYDILDNSMIQSLFFGMVIGTIGIGGWKIFFSLHPAPPPVLLKNYLPVIWLGHLVMAIVLHYCIIFFASAPVTVSIPIC